MGFIMISLYKKYLAGVYFLVLYLEADSKLKFNWYLAYSTLLIVLVSQFAFFYGLAVIFGVLDLVVNISFVSIYFLTMVVINWCLFFKDCSYQRIVKNEVENRNKQLSLSLILTVLMSSVFIASIVIDIVAMGQ